MDNNSPNFLPADSLEHFDPDVYYAINQESLRQNDHIELIASENFTLPAILQAQGSILTNKYAEGYPAKRYYGGCQHVDTIEQLAIDRACQLFNAEHANVQPHSGSQANFAVYTALLQPKDTLLTMSLECGGHLTHGSPVNFSGKHYHITHYGVDLDTGYIDYDALETQAKTIQPKMITVGASAYPRIIDFERIAGIAKKTGALVLADIAHIAGLVATGEHPNPTPYVDCVTTTTHKSLQGPRGGLILCKKKHARLIDTAIFPGTQGGPLMHTIAAKATCFRHASTPLFKTYTQCIKKNAQALATALLQKGYKLCSGGTDNHLILIDLRKKFPNLTGKEAQEALDKAHITTNRNTVPQETRSPFITSGLRIGTPAVTARGLHATHMQTIADAIDTVLHHPNDPDTLKAIRKKIMALCEKFPLPY